uniref:Beta-1,4-galactosyltransferase 2-like n=1 Tax=Phallusia mammillata TaxID=59560 RepID=A0A6F9D838_9ASCI|nr:beta-1,4-galactosyltransferase 2-like [Phallusia mammillata]
MTLLQRISRSISSCGFIPSRWLRRPGKRKYVKVFLVGLFTLVAALSMSRRNSDHPYNSNIRVPSDAHRFSEEIRKVPKSVEYDVKEEAASRHLMGLKNCSETPSELLGTLFINPNITPSYEEVEKVSGPDLLKGGCYVPTACKPLQKVAVIIPFKDRDAHLKTLLYYLHPILKRQKTKYCIYVAEQFDNGQFNKAMVMNAAFEEAMKLDSYDCIVFHDVDMIPENDMNMYMCGNQPRHLSPAIDKFEYKPHYGTDFGGVTGISPKQYRKANGHSNQFWGWGGEDNDMEFRIFYNKMKIVPSDLKVGRYKMIVHKHPWKFSPNQFPFRLNKTREIRATTDGLSDLKYLLVDTVRQSTYTKFVIDVRRIEVKRITLFVDGKPTMDIDINPVKGACVWKKWDGITLEDVYQFDRLTIYHSLDLAKRECEAMGLVCGGVVKEDNGEHYTLHLKAMPRHREDILERLIKENNGKLPLGALGNDLRHAQLRIKELAALGEIKLDHRFDDNDTSHGLTKREFSNYILPFHNYHGTPTAYIKYCPSILGAYQPLPQPIEVHVDKNIMNWVDEHYNGNIRHYFSFEVEMKVILTPSKFLYYRDSKHFEAQLNKGENFYTFHWPTDKIPDFSKPDTPREYMLKTVEFTIPNIPGCYAVESKIQDRYQQPYFQWNWWFEVTSGDRQVDAAAREVYWRKQMNDNAVQRANSKMSDARQQEAKQAKREREFQKKMAEIHRNDLRIQENHLKGINEKPKAVEVEKPPKRNNVREDIDDYERAPKESLPIEVYDPMKTIAPVIQGKYTSPAPFNVGGPVHRQFHGALPKHLKEKAAAKNLQKA